MTDFRLNKIWEKIFSRNFILKQCPFLIGITTFSRQKIDTGMTVEYQFKELVCGDWLIMNPGEINHEDFFNMLKEFKAEHDANEKNLVGIIFVFLHSQNSSL